MSVSSTIRSSLWATGFADTCSTTTRALTHASDISEHSPRSRFSPLRGFSPMPDRESFTHDAIASDEPFECQECHWRGQRASLARVANPDGSVELACPNRIRGAHRPFSPVAELGAGTATWLGTATPRSRYRGRSM